MNKDELKKMIDNESTQRILDHTNKCPYCQHLQSALGFLIEKHMEEYEQKEKLT